MTAEKAAEMGCTPLAKIVGYADGATDPIDFPIAPKFALDKLMAQVFPFSVIVHVLVLCLGIFLFRLPLVGWNGSWRC